MGTSRWINNYVKEFPIPMVEPEQQTEIITIVDRIFQVKAASLNANTADLEKEIDKRVYALYNLTRRDCYCRVSDRVNCPNRGLTRIAQLSRIFWIRAI